MSCLSADGSQLLWSTYLGGLSNDILFDLAVDDSGWVTAVGLTLSDDFPTTPAAYDTTHNGSYDAAVVRLSADGSQLLYSTYLGDVGEEWALAIGLDDSGEVVTGGYTSSTGFPTTPGAYDTIYNGGSRDAFVTRLNADGSGLVYSTFLGGSDEEGRSYYWPFPYANIDRMDLALDGSGETIVVGRTISPDFPTTPGAYDISHNDSFDIFVTRLNPNGSNLVHSTFLGGKHHEGVYCVALHGAGEVTIGGITRSQDFPTTPGAYDSTFNGVNDGLVARFDATLSSLLYSTLIGGRDGDGIRGVAVDVSGDIALTGWAVSYDFPTTPWAYDPSFNGVSDAVLARISPDGNGQADLVYSTFLGGGGGDACYDMAAVDDSTVVLVGHTESWDLPTTPDAYDTTYNGMVDAFVLRFGLPLGVQEHDRTPDPPQVSAKMGRVWPNPTRGQLNYSVDLPGRTRVRVCIFDICGCLVRTLIDEYLPVGSHTFSANLDGGEEKLASGVYYLHLAADGAEHSRKFILLR